MNNIKLAISNIAWDNEKNEKIYSLMKKYDFTGLEIAPTKVVGEAPYDDLSKIEVWYKSIYEEYGFCIPSMQSIWFGKQEKIFGTNEERKILLDYTKKAIDFAKIINCKNLVFGCPRNRGYEDGIDVDSIAVPFFKELADYAFERGTCIGMEANPAMYNTNFINYTDSALELVTRVNSKGYKLNLDIGTMICNGEDIELLKGNVCYINHIHISEPGLKPIERRDIHNELIDILIDECYDSFISIEMATVDDMYLIEDAMSYISELAGHR